MSSLPKWVRWILVLPACIGARILVNIIMNWVKEDTPLPDFIIIYPVTLLANFSSSFATVKAGVEVAPSNKGAVAIVLCVMNIVFISVSYAGILVFAQEHEMNIPKWWAIVCGIAAIIASVAACIEEFSELLDSKKDSEESTTNTEGI